MLLNLENTIITTHYTANMYAIRELRLQFIYILVTAWVEKLIHNKS